MAKLNSNNEYIVTENDLVELMLQGITPSTVTMKETATINKYNHFCNLFLLDSMIDVDTASDNPDKYSYKFVENWYMPDEYKNYPIYDYCIKKCDTIEQKQRVMDEFDEYDSRGLLPLLYYMKYLVDTMRSKDIIWGVGRGSSVASYVLYLIGIHKIDSVKYNLDYKEFFR